MFAFETTRRRANIYAPNDTEEGGELGYTTGIPLDTGDCPVPISVTGLYPRRGYRFGHRYQV